MHSNVQAKRQRRAVAGIVSAALVAGIALAAAAPTLAVNGGACKRPYTLTVDPASFEDAHGDPNAIDNNYFPLVPGTTFTYEGVKDGAPLTDVMTVTSDTRTIMGVTVRVVHDSASTAGGRAEGRCGGYAQGR